MSIKTEIENYFFLQKQIHEYFGYIEDWVTIPLSDETNHPWFLLENNPYRTG